MTLARNTNIKKQSVSINVFINKNCCFTGISSAESKIRDDPCAYKHELPDIENHISSKKKPWYKKFNPCKLGLCFNKITVSIQNESLLSFCTVIRKIRLYRKEKKNES